MMTESVDDRSSLIANAVGGDRTALQTLLLVYYPQIESSVRLRFNEQLARFVEPNDLIQEVLIKVHRNIRSYQEREDGSFEAWLSTIAANCVVDAARHYKRHKRGGTTLRVDDHPKSSNESLDTIWDWICEDSRLPEHSVRRAEARGALQVCLSELNPAQREAVVAHYFEHLDVKEIAIRMGRTPGAVRELLRRAQNQLRELMGSASVWLSGR